MDFNVYIFPARARTTLMSITIFGGKKMYSGRRQGCFSSNYAFMLSYDVPLLYPNE